MSKIAVFIVISILTLGSHNVFSWGRGHNSQAEQVWKLFPESFKSHYTEKQRQDFVRYYSHYPDFAVKNLSSRNEPAAKTLRDTIKKMKLNKYDVHRTYTIFPLFVQALREKKYDDALMWAGCIMHSIGDMGALNHPDIGFFPIVCLGWSGVKFDNALIPDLLYYKTYFNKSLQPLYDKVMNGYEGEIISTDPDEVLRHIIVRDYYRKEEMNVNPNVYRLFSAHGKYTKKDPDASAEIAECMAKYVKSVNCEILDTLITGIAFSKMEGIPKFDCKKAKKNAFSKKYKSSPKHSIKAKNMIVFTGLWQEKSIPGATAIIISDRPSLVYSGGCHLGSNHQLLTSMILRTFKEGRKTYQCISYERLPELNPKINPELIVMAPKLRGKSFLKGFGRALVKYMNDGGRVIWLGGIIAPALAKFLPENRFPVRIKGDKFKFPFPVFDKKKKVDAKFVRIADGKEFFVPKMTLNKLSWNTFGECRCLFFDDFANDKNKKALLRLKTPTIDKIVAVKVKAGKGELIYIPWYVICPYMLSENRVMKSITDLKLDNVGKELLKLH